MFKKSTVKFLHKVAKSEKTNRKKAFVKAVWLMYKESYSPKKNVMLNFLNFTMEV